MTTFIVCYALSSTVAGYASGSYYKQFFSSRDEAQAENFQKMAMAMAKDIRVIMVKMADRLHNMRTIGVMSDAQRKRIARETIEFYAPIANRLGVQMIKSELEELAFRALYPLRKLPTQQPKHRHGTTPYSQKGLGTSRLNNS